MNPTDGQIDAYFDRLEKLDLKKLRLRLKDALRRDRSGSASPDGFPSQTMGGSRGGSELTPTEAAANALIFGRDRDDHHKFTSQACDMLDQGVMSLNAVVNLLAKVDALVEDKPVVEADHDCEACSRHPSLKPRKAKHFADVAGRLNRKYRLCGPCYSFCYQQTTDVALPTVEQLEEYDRRGSWRVVGFVGGMSR